MKFHLNVWLTEVDKLYLSVASCSIQTTQSQMREGSIESDLEPHQIGMHSPTLPVRRRIWNVIYSSNSLNAISFLFFFALSNELLLLFTCIFHCQLDSHFLAWHLIFRHKLLSIFSSLSSHLTEQLRHCSLFCLLIFHSVFFYSILDERNILVWQQMNKQ